VKTTDNRQAILPQPDPGPNQVSVHRDHCWGSSQIFDGTNGIRFLPNNSPCDFVHWSNRALAAKCGAIWKLSPCCQSVGLGGDPNVNITNGSLDCRCGCDCRPVRANGSASGILEGPLHEHAGSLRIETRRRAGSTARPSHYSPWNNGQVILPWGVSNFLDESSPPSNRPQGSIPPIELNNRENQSRPRSVAEPTNQSVSSA
jgi:hypothetical protein